jgi:NhaP-type Na+/H+ or K+/H+ antiporter
MLPVCLCLARTDTDLPSRLFIGWFGPRGLASIVFAIIVFDEKLPGNDVLMMTVACTILLSVLAHGATANLVASRFGRRQPPEHGKVAS